MPADAWAVELPATPELPPALELPATPAGGRTVELPATQDRAPRPAASATPEDAWTAELPASPEVPAGPAASATPENAWTVELPASPEAPAGPAVSATPENAWTVELPASPEAPAGPAVSATPEDAWTAGLPATPEAEPPEAVVPVSAFEGQYALTQHLDGKPEAIVELFGQLDEYARGLDATRQIRQHHVEYLRGEKACFTMEVERERILLCLSLDAATVEAWWWSPGVKRYTIDIRRRDNDRVECSVGAAAQLGDARLLIKLAYNGPYSPHATR
jgi:hypothetical protein